MKHDDGCSANMGRFTVELDIKPPVDVYRIRRRVSLRQDRLAGWLLARGWVHQTQYGEWPGILVLILRVWAFPPWRGRTWQAEWLGCQRAVRGWTRRGCRRKAWKAMG